MRKYSNIFTNFVNWEIVLISFHICPFFCKNLNYTQECFVPNRVEIDPGDSGEEDSFLKFVDDFWSFF